MWLTVGKGEETSKQNLQEERFYLKSFTVRVLRQGSIVAFGSSEESSFLKMPVESEMLIVVNKRALGDVASTETTGSVLVE